MIGDHFKYKGKQAHLELCMQCGI